MLRSICLKLVTAAAVVVCVGFATSACVVRDREVVHHEDHRDYHWGHHDRY